MEVVGAFACSHAGLIYERREQAPPEQLAAVLDGYGRMRRTIEELAPDALVVVGTDHGKIYPLTCSPQYVIGVSERARGIGDATLPRYEAPLHQELAQSLLLGGMQRGIDFAFSEDMAIDHSFVTVLMLTNPEARFPIVPVVQNCNVAPRPALIRSYKVGKKLGKALRGGPKGRVVVIGTGGLSHWVGSAERRAFNSRPPGSRLPRMSECPPLVLEPTGPINVEFDHLFLDVMKLGQARSFAHEWSDERLEDTAGNGAHELRNWLTVAGITGDCPAEVLAYEPVAEWLTGFGVIQFKLGEHPWP